MFQFVTACRHAVTVDKMAVATAPRRGIGKIDYPSVAHITARNIFSHTPDLRFAEKIDLTTRRSLKHHQIVERLARRMPPVGGSFLTRAVGLDIIQELVDRLHTAIHGPGCTRDSSCSPALLYS